MGSRGQTVGPANKMEGSSYGSRLQAGASNATTPSGNGATQRPSSALAVPSSTSGRYSPSFPNPVTRTASACFPVTRTPSDKGLAMIRSNLHESTPPPTEMSWEEALAVLHKLEKQLTINVQEDLERLRYRMTSSKIDLVARKCQRLYQMRVLLRNTRRLVKEEESVMTDFNGVKAVIESGGHSSKLDEDEYMDTKVKLLSLGTKLTDTRRRMQRIAGQVEELQMAANELVDASNLAEIEGYEFDMEKFKKESSALPEMPRLAPSLPSYDLFNHAPYSNPPSRPGSSMSIDSDRPSSAVGHRIHRTVKVSVAADSTDEEETGSEAYFPQRSKKKKADLSSSGRRRAPSETSDAESEDAYQVYTNTRMTPMEAKQKAEEDRKNAAEEQAKIKQHIDQQMKREEEEEMRKQEEQVAKKKEEEEKQKSIMDAKQKAAAEKAAQLEAKKKAEEEKKKADQEAKEAKKQKEEEEKRKKEEAEAKKKEEAEAKKKAEEEAKQREEEERRQQEEAKKEAEAKRAKEQQAKQEAESKKQAEMRRREEEAARKQEEELARQREEEEMEQQRELELQAKQKRGKKTPTQQ